MLQFLILIQNKSWGEQKAHLELLVGIQVISSSFSICYLPFFAIGLCDFHLILAVRKLPPPLNYANGMLIRFADNTKFEGLASSAGDRIGAQNDLKR